jgi:serine/threonine protein kinase
LIAETGTAEGRPPPTGGEGSTIAWLEALSSGRCTAQAFLAAVRERFRENADGNWEVLSLLDQYYRRGRIKPDIFQTLKSHLEDSVLGGEADAPAAGRALPRIVTAPAVTPPPVVTSVARPATRPATRPTASPAVASATPPIATSRKVNLPAPEIAIGDVLRSRYRVIRVLGRGGMGTVFEAADEYRLDLLPTGQRIALKVLHTAVTEREELLCELQREFQHLQSLSHPNIVRVHEFDRDGDTAFFTMELLNGALLSRVLNARHSAALPRAHALAIIRDAGAALAHAHSRGVVHGDVNPQNIFFTNEGELRVLDFGAAHSMRRTGWSADDASSLGPPVATLGYASCQLLEGQRPDARDDVFAFACVIYLLLSGKHPFPGSSAVEAREKRIRPRRPSGLSGPQWRVLREGLRWDRARRPSDVQNWLDRLGLQGAVSHLPPLPQLITSPPPRSNKAWLSVAAILWLALLAAGGYWVATNYDSLARAVAGWHLPGSSEAPIADAPAAADAPVPSAPAPVQSAPAPSLPATAPSPSAPAPAVSATAPAPEAGGSAPAMPAAPRAQSADPTPSPPVANAAAVPVRPSAATPSPPPAHSPTVWQARVELAADTVDVPPTERSARVVVHRTGSLRGAAPFTWWTESGTAKPGVDFIPVLPRTGTIEDGSNGVSLDIDISATSRRQSKSFYVVIDQAESGAALGPRTLTMVTLQPED